MDFTFIESLESHLNRLGRSFFFLKSFFCCVKTFPTGSVCWKKRQSLRRRLVWELTVKNIPQSPLKKTFLKHLLQPAESLINPFMTISLSHCPGLGGFVFSFDKNFFLGFDMELSSRPTRKILSRISGKKELNEAPLPALLWTAKEAAFKSAGQAFTPRPRFLKDCVISRWRQTEAASYQFRFCRENEGKTRGLGIAFLKGQLSVAMALINKSS